MAESKSFDAHDSAEKVEKPSEPESLVDAPQQEDINKIVLEQRARMKDTPSGITGRDALPFTLDLDDGKQVRSGAVTNLSFDDTIDQMQPGKPVNLPDFDIRLDEPKDLQLLDKLKSVLEDPTADATEPSIFLAKSEVPDVVPRGLVEEKAKTKSNKGAGPSPEVSAEKATARVSDQQKDSAGQTAEKPTMSEDKKEILSGVAEAIHKELHGAGRADKERIARLLEGRTPQEIAEIKQAYKQYDQKVSGNASGAELKDDIAGTWWTGGEKVRISNLLEDRRGDAKHRAGYIDEKVTELDQWLRGPNNSVLEKSVREMVSNMTPEQLKELRTAYEEKHGKDSFNKDLMDRVSPKTKEALDIYLKNGNELSTADRLKLADIAVKHGDVQMLQEALGKPPGGAEDKAVEAREKFLQNGGEQKITEAFGKVIEYRPSPFAPPKANEAKVRYEENDTTRHAMDIVKHGEIPVVRQIKDNTGIFKNNQGVDNALSSMTEAERKAYSKGQKLDADIQSGKAIEERMHTYADMQTHVSKEEREASYREAEARLSRAEKQQLELYRNERDGKLSAEQVSQLGTYRDTHQAMEDADFYCVPSRMRYWESLVQEEDPTIGKVREAEGWVWNSEKNSRDIEDAVLQMPPERRQQYLEGKELSNKLASGEQRADDLSPVQQKSLEYYQKLHHQLEESDPSKVGRLEELIKTGYRPVLDDLNDPERAVSAIKAMSPEERQRYKENPQFQQKLDEKIRGIEDEHQRKAAELLLKQVKQHPEQEPKEDLAVRLHLTAKEMGSTEIAQLHPQTKAINDVLDHLKDQPKPAQLPADSEQTLRTMLTPEQYKKYIEPALKGEQISIADRAALHNANCMGKDLSKMATDDRTYYEFKEFPADKPALYRELTNLTPEEKKLLSVDLRGKEPHLDDPETAKARQLQDKVFAGLVEDERAEAQLIVKQGSVNPEDYLRLMIKSRSTDLQFVEKTLEGRTQEEREKIMANYHRKYGGDLSVDLESNASAGDKSAVVELFHNPDRSAAEVWTRTAREYEKSRSSYLPFETVTDGTALQLDQQFHKFSQNVADEIGKLSPEQQRELQKQILAGLEAYKTSKEAMANNTMAMITAIAAGTQVMNPLAMAAACALLRPGVHQAVRGLDYTAIGSDGLRDAARGMIDYAGSKFGGDQFNAAFNHCFGPTKRWVIDAAVRAGGNAFTGATAAVVGEVASKWDGTPENLREIAERCPQLAIRAALISASFSMAGSVATRGIGRIKESLPEGAPNLEHMETGRGAPHDLAADTYIAARGRGKSAQEATRLAEDAYLKAKAASPENQGVYQASNPAGGVIPGTLRPQAPRVEAPRAVAAGESKDKPAEDEPAKVADAAKPKPTGTGSTLQRTSSESSEPRKPRAKEKPKE